MCFDLVIVCTSAEPTVEGNQQIVRLKKELNELRAALKNKDLEYATKESDLKTKVRIGLFKAAVYFGTYNFY